MPELNPVYRQPSNLAACAGRGRYAVDASRLYPGVWRTATAPGFREFESAKLMALVTNLRPEAHRIDGEDRFWMKQETREGARFVVVDAASGTQKPAFDHARLAAALAGAGIADADADNLPIVSLRLGGESGVVFDIIRVDEAERVVYFTAGGREDGRNPYYAHLYRASCDGCDAELLTQKNAAHEFFRYALPVRLGAGSLSRFSPSGGVLRRCLPDHRTTAGHGDTQLRRRTGFRCGAGISTMNVSNPARPNDDVQGITNRNTPKPRSSKPIRLPRRCR